MKYLLLNHKMNLLGSDLLSYLDNLPKYENLIIFPSYIYIPYFLGKGYNIGSQDISSRNMGSVTSEVSASQLKSIGVAFSLIGHSERRKNHPEENQEIPSKIKNAQENGITSILCIGDTPNVDKFSYLEKEINDALSQVTSLKNIWIAYEPLANIGSGQAMEIEEIDTTINWIKNYLKTKYNTSTTVLYGGSVSSKNISELKTCQADGFLVGSSGLKVEEVQIMVKELENDRRSIS